LHGLDSNAVVVEATAGIEPAYTVLQACQAMLMCVLVTRRPLKFIGEIR
jgi:hypothetical protein